MTYIHSICGSYGVRVYTFESWGGWDGPLLLPLLFPLHSWFPEAFPQGDCGPLRAVLLLISCSNISTPTCVRVWFHVFDSEITGVFCNYVSVGLE